MSTKEINKSSRKRSSVSKAKRDKTVKSSPSKGEPSHDHILARTLSTEDPPLTPEYVHPIEESPKTPTIKEETPVKTPRSSEEPIRARATPKYDKPSATIGIGSMGNFVKNALQNMIEPLEEEEKYDEHQENTESIIRLNKEEPSTPTHPQRKTVPAEKERESVPIEGITEVSLAKKPEREKERLVLKSNAGTKPAEPVITSTVEVLDTPSKDGRGFPSPTSSLNENPEHSEFLSENPPFEERSISHPLEGADTTPKEPKSPVENHHKKPSLRNSVFSSIFGGKSKPKDAPKDETEVVPEAEITKVVEPVTLDDREKETTLADAMVDRVIIMSDNEKDHEAAPSTGIHLDGHPGEEMSSDGETTGSSFDDGSSLEEESRDIDINDDHQEETKLQPSLVEEPRMVGVSTDEGSEEGKSTTQPDSEQPPYDENPQEEREATQPKLVEPISDINIHEGPQEERVVFTQSKLVETPRDESPHKERVAILPELAQTRDINTHEGPREERAVDVQPKLDKGKNPESLSKALDHPPLVTDKELRQEDSPEQLFFQTYDLCINYYVIILTTFTNFDLKEKDEFLDLTGRIKFGKKELRVK